MIQINRSRMKSSYTDSENKAAYLIAFNPDKLIHYGSASKKAMYLSASDMDLIEPIPASKADALADRMRTIVRAVARTKRAYLGDIKSGSDPMFVTDIGKVKGNSVVGFRKDAVRAFVKSRGFQEEKAILALLEERMTVPRFLELQELMRKDQVLRWSKTEVEKGYKLLRGKKISLSDCIRDTNSMTKVDTIQWVSSENRFVEVTNYFKVSKDKQSFHMVDYAESLKKDILKTNNNGNLFKMCKRILSLSLLLKDKKGADRMYNIVHSGIGILYQVIGDIKSILYLKENVKQLPLASIKGMIDGFKRRLGNIYEFDFRELAIDRLINDCKDDLEKLYDLYDRLYGVLIKETKMKLDEAGLLPLPLKYYPK
jgi:hypothetical protein